MRLWPPDQHHRGRLVVHYRSKPTFGSGTPTIAAIDATLFVCFNHWHNLSGHFLTPGATSGEADHPDIFPLPRMRFWVQPWPPPWPRLLSTIPTFPVALSGQPEAELLRPLPHTSSLSPRLLILTGSNHSLAIVNVFKRQACRHPHGLDYPWSRPLALVPVCFLCPHFLPMSMTMFVPTKSSSTILVAWFSQFDLI